MSSASTTRLWLSDEEAHQLAALVANMLEAHLRTSLAEQESKQEFTDQKFDECAQQDQRCTHAQEGLGLHSTIEHGASQAPSRKHRTPVCVAR